MTDLGFQSRNSGSIPPMKTSLIRFITVSLLATVLPAILCAKETPEQLRGEREAILSQIVAYHESRLATGGSSDEAVADARMALYAFRRDQAEAVAEKIKQQELIVQEAEKKVAGIEARKRSGVGTELDVLQAKDALLREKLVLLTLKPKTATP